MAVDLLIGVWLICYGNNKCMGELQPYLMQGELLAQDEIVCFAYVLLLSLPNGTG